MREVCNGGLAVVQRLQHHLPKPLVHPASALQPPFPTSPSAPLSALPSAPFSALPSAPPFHLTLPVHSARPGQSLERSCRERCGTCVAQSSSQG
ncbi:unnamed protein product [Closterium sp. NIES-53]